MLTAKPVRDRLIGLGLLAVLMAAWVLDPGPMVSIRLRALDLAAAFRPLPERPPTVVVVDIDDQSLGVIGQWPWPRNVIGEIVERLAQDGVEVVVLDMLLAETDRTSPLRLSLAGSPNPEAPTAVPAPAVTVTAAARAAARQPGDHDTALAEALGAVPAVTGAALSAVSLPIATAGPLVSRFAVRGTARLDHVPQSPGIVRPLALLEVASRGVGLVNLFPDPDGILRTVPGAAAVGESLVPGLALEAVRIALGAESLVLEAPPGAGPDGVSVGGRLIPTDMRGRVWIDSRDPSRIPVVSADRLLAGGVRAEDLAGRVAIVGASASGIAAPLRTASGDGVSSALFQAMAVDSILDGRVLARPPGRGPSNSSSRGRWASGLLWRCPGWGWLGSASPPWRCCWRCRPARWSPRRSRACWWMRAFRSWSASALPGAARSSGSASRTSCGGASRNCWRSRASTCVRWSTPVSTPSSRSTPRRGSAPPTPAPSGCSACRWTVCREPGSTPLLMGAWADDVRYRSPGALEDDEASSAASSSDEASRKMSPSFDEFGEGDEGEQEHVTT